MKPKVNIVIVGGGMVGVSLALMLAQQSDRWSITLVERHAFDHRKLFQPSFDSRSTALSARSIDLLKDIHCWDGLAEKAQAIRQIHVSDRGHWGGALLNAEDYSLEALGYIVENGWLGSRLIERLAQTNIQLLAPAKVTRCVPKKQHCQLLVKDHREESVELSADLVIIADGAESPLRQALGIDAVVKDYQQTALVANVALAHPHQSVAYERFTDQGPIALLPLPDIQLADHRQQHRAALVWTVDSHQLPDENNSIDLTRLLQQSFGYRAGNILQIGEVHSYPLQLVKASEQVRSNLVIMGNAAHFLHPVAGQGFNLALRDCYVLTQVLVEAAERGEPIGHYSTLKPYLDVQEQDQQVTIKMTDSLVKLFSSKQLANALVRQLGLLSLQLLPVAKKQFAERMMGMPV